MKKITLTQKQIDIALALPADVMVTTCLKKIKLGQMTWQDMRLLCDKRMADEEEETTNVARDIGLF